MAGIKDSLELLTGANELTLFLIKRLKDGIGVDDAVAIITKLTTDKDFMDKMQAAIEGINKVGKEMSDLDLAEGLKLAELQLKYIPKYMDAAKG